MSKKMGRPTNAIKDTVIKVRIDTQTKQMLEYCASVSEKTKSDIVRMGIKEIYNVLQEGQEK